MRIKILSLLLCLALILSLAACSETEPENNNPSNDAPPQEIQDESEDPVELEETEEPDGPLTSGSYTLPCGMELQFWDSVRNDVTGNWRRSATSSSLVPADYALEYYSEMFSSDDEIHSVWNATLGTTTRITVSGNLLFVDTLEYVDGEEHDANIMFSGEVLDSKIFDIETGELWDE